MSPQALMVQTMVAGQAAGAAAAVATRRGCQPREVPITEMQAELARQDVSPAP